MSNEHFSDDGTLIDASASLDAGCVYEHELGKILPTFGKPLPGAQGMTAATKGDEP